MAARSLSLSTLSIASSVSAFTKGTTSFPNFKFGGGGLMSIRRVRVGGVEIPSNKRVEFSLQYIHGIGRSLSKQILADVGVDNNKVTKELSTYEVIRLRDRVSKYMIEGDLKRSNWVAIERLKGIGCYRGFRHEMGLPCRGQRTKTNCMTLRGKKRVTVVDNKKASR